MDGFDRAYEAVAGMMHEEGWLDRLDPDTMAFVMERLNRERYHAGFAISDEELDRRSAEYEADMEARIEAEFEDSIHERIAAEERRIAEEQTDGGW